jgi:ADP-ribose pyrophosphatase YjhB (NUDIX family)
MTRNPQTVPDHLRPWSEPWPDYRPSDITPPELREDGTLAESVREGWAEPFTDPTVIDFEPLKEVALLRFGTANGWPLNPTGRTGKSGRNLGRWGENAATDSVVIADGHILLIRRTDCDQWATPGGMVEPGEPVLAALVRELFEETGLDLSHITPQILANTYVDDPRNSDHAWVCSTVGLFRIPARVPVVAADDARAAQWFPFHSVHGLRDAVAAVGGDLYAAHLPLFELAARANDPRYAQTTEMFAVMHWDKHDTPKVVTPDRALAVRYIAGQWSDEFYSTEPIEVILWLPERRPFYTVTEMLPTDPDKGMTHNTYGLDNPTNEFPGLGNGTMVPLGETKSSVEESGRGWHVSAAGWDRQEVEAAYNARVAEAMAARAARAEAFRAYVVGTVVTTGDNETLMRVAGQSGELVWHAASGEIRHDSDVDPATLTVVVVGTVEDQR